MKMHLRWIVAMVMVLATIVHPSGGEAFTVRDLTYGSMGYDVNELQGRLSNLGYYHGKNDGNFGWSTYWAVRDFQYSFGMKVTGRADMNTKIKLVRATPNWNYRQDETNSPGGSSAAASSPGASSAATAPANPPGTAATAMPTAPGLSASDVQLMTHVVYAEARGEPFVGQVAIAAVIINRLSDPRFPHTVAGIVYQPGAFTSVQDGQINLPPNPTATKAVADAAHGWDPALGAVYYFNPATATSGWMWTRPQITKIGKHIFCN